MDQTEDLRAIARSMGRRATAFQEAERHLLLRQAAELEEEARRIENLQAGRLNVGKLSRRFYRFVRGFPAKLGSPARARPHQPVQASTPRPQPR